MILKETKLQILAASATRLEDVAGGAINKAIFSATLKIRGVRGRLLRQESRKGCVDTMGVERDIGREPRSDAVRVVGIDLYNQAMTGGVSKTLNNRATDSDHIPCVLVYESHGQDCRYKPLVDVCSTVSQKYGTGGATRR